MSGVGTGWFGSRSNRSAIGSKKRRSMQERVRSARRSSAPRRIGFHMRAKRTRRMASASSRKSLTPKPIGFRSGRKERNHSKKNMGSERPHNGRCMGSSSKQEPAHDRDRG